MKKFLLVSTLLLLVSCSSQERNELKKSFAVKVAEKVQDASVHSLECKTGQPVFEDVKREVESFLKVEDSSEGQKSVLLTQLCHQGVKIAFPHLVDLGTGELPESWKLDGCSLDSIGDDLEKFADKFCEKLE